MSKTIPDSREELKQWCLRKLGAPVLSIDVAEEQVQDRIDEAIQYYQDFHHDGTERVYFKHEVTTQNISDRFIDIEDPGIMSVNKLFAFSSGNINMFDIRYQIRLNDFYNFNNVSMINYQVARQHLALLDFLFDQQPSVRFNRVQNRIFVDFDWNNDIALGDFMIFDCLRAIDPEEWNSMYNDKMLKAYTTALIKEQWGENLSKFSGVAATGGVTLRGDKIKTEAQKEIESLKREFEMKYQNPLSFEIG